MKVLGIITEYNPFHQGHQLHLNKSLEKSKADACICIMSGSFLQRGTPAIINQWARTEMALRSGVDLLIQLPVVYSLRSAEHFAWGAVKLLDSTKITDTICFGSELGQIEPLVEIAKILLEEPAEFKFNLKNELDHGLSYPQARSNALKNYLDSNPNITVNPKQSMQIITNPNNILGLEYIKALLKLDSAIQPLTIQRQGSSYHEKEIKPIASASAIRRAIEKNFTKGTELINLNLAQLLPELTTSILNREFSNNLGPIFYDDFGDNILTILRRMTRDEIKKFENVHSGLENRIKDAADQATSLTDLINLIKTKRFTQTRIQRILSQILLNITEKDLLKFDLAGGPQYFRVLGFNNRGRHLLKLIKERSSLPLITNLSNHYQSSYQPQNILQEMINYDLRANNIYTLAYQEEKFRQGNIDFKKRPVII